MDPLSLGADMEGVDGWMDGWIDRFLHPCTRRPSQLQRGGGLYLASGSALQRAAPDRVEALSDRGPGLATQVNADPYHPRLLLLARLPPRAAPTTEASLPGRQPD